jgi:dipeptidyl aminopeptidase/acylaminoacyl peptidase
MRAQVWILGYSSDSVNNKFYLHYPGTWPPQLLFDTQPALKPYSTAKSHPVVIAARDGVRLPSYLTLPVKAGVPQAFLPACAAGAVPDLTAQERRDLAAHRLASRELSCPLGLKLPLVLAVHGGPWSRDTWGSDGVVQLLANRGYAVLQVNYRGSSGYGKRFTNLGDRQWGVGAMQHDLTDAVRWAVRTGIADARRVCIMGGSYGGYATLAGLTFTPELYACGLDLVGISNVGTFMRSIPAYWQPLRYEWVTRVGPADTNDTLNRAISPLFHAHRIRVPLHIAQGANDPRVPQAESDQMFRAMARKRLPVEYVLYPDEGHGLDRADNRQDYYARVEQFLARHIGGRAGPPLAFRGSSARVIRSEDDIVAAALDAAARDGEQGGAGGADAGGSAAAPRGAAGRGAAAGIARARG